MAGFDPYHRWLGIPPKHQPANHYRLLGIELFEGDPEVIRDAAERQIGHVRRYQLGAHSALSQQILNELAAAKACLLNLPQKLAYDQQLRRETDTTPMVEPTRASFSASTMPPPVHPPHVPSEVSKTSEVFTEAAASTLGNTWSKPPSAGSYSRGLFGRLDSRLLQLAGDNQIVHGFLRVLACGAPVLALVAASVLGWRVIAGSSQTPPPEKATIVTAPPSKPPLPTESDPGKTIVTTSPATPTPPEPVIESTPAEITNSIGMKLVLIPMGEFQMGSPSSEAGRRADEQQHRVRITRPFYLGTTEVTQGQWEAVMGTTPWRGNSYVKEGSDYPASYVGWDDAVEFCRRLSDKESLIYRLPSEAEWEYACRAESTTAYSFGDSSASLKDYAWFRENAWDANEKYAHRVGQKRANAFGLYDLHGNVGEWCEDWYDKNYYATAAATKPDPVNTTTATYRVLRGGSWSFSPGLTRSASRNLHDPEFRYDYDGFRVARSPLVPVITAPWSKPQLPTVSDPDKTTVTTAPTTPTPPAAVIESVPVEITNSIAMKLRLIPAGEFMMGSPSSETDRDADEQQHRVPITRPFYLGVYEVTVGQFRAFVNDSGYKTEAEKDGEGGYGFNLSTGKFEGRDPKYNWRSTGFAQADDHSVVNVTWNDADAFCKWLSRMEGKTYRLPTEAEWEYACRAGTTTAYNDDSDDQDSLQLIANIADASFKSKFAAGTYAKSWNDGYPFTAPAGSFKPNRFGLHDMHGNVYEWCEDWYDEDYYATAGATKPNPVNTTTATYRVLRGGSWFNLTRYARSADRNWNSPADRYSNHGFRVARSPLVPVITAPWSKLPTVSDPDKTTVTTAPPTPIPPATVIESTPAEITNSIGMKLVLIPAGEFMMGSPKSETGRGDDEGADGPHRVRITRPFYLGTTEVTQGQWEEVMRTTPWRGQSYVKEGSDYPATYVSWNDAVEFCRKLSAKESLTYRLPTEAEWEYACRAGSTTAYSFGNSAARLKDYAWIRENTNDANEKYAHRVGQMRDNDFGLYDMHGNVWEWCEDWYDEDFYSKAAATEPNPVNTTTTTAAWRVLRGGSWSYITGGARSAFRGRTTPGDRLNNVGFRVMRTP